jgi:hypothetical protein
LLKIGHQPSAISHQASAGHPGGGAARRDFHQPRVSKRH